MLYDKSVSELIACPRLKDEITIPDGIQTISPFAFYSCQNLRVINMPNSITMLGEAGFLNYIIGYSSRVKDFKEVRNSFFVRYTVGLIV